MSADLHARPRSGPVWTFASLTAEQVTYFHDMLKGLKMIWYYCLWRKVGAKEGQGTWHETETGARVAYDALAQDPDVTLKAVYEVPADAIGAVYQDGEERKSVDLNKSRVILHWERS